MTINIEQDDIVELIPEPIFTKSAIGFKGIDGGNIKAKLWFCAIEHGGHQDHTNSISSDTYLYESNGEHWNVPFDKSSPSNKLDERLSVLAAQCLSCDEQVMQQKLFTECGSAFKMNLYPLNFPSFKSYENEIPPNITTGFEEKTIYKAWCMRKRFPFLRRILASGRASVLVCVGIDAWSDFWLAFPPMAGTKPQRIFAEGVKPMVYEHTWRAPEGKKVVTVYSTPFPMRRGMGRAEIITLGKYIRSKHNLNE